MFGVINQFALKSWNSHVPLCLASHRDDIFLLPLLMCFLLYAK